MDTRLKPPEATSRPLRFSRKVLSRFYEWRHAPRIHACILDGWNRVRYGLHAPRFAERLWVDPRRVQHYDRKGLVWNSGRVQEGEWPTGNQRPIEEDPILQTSIARWVHGLAWEETGEIERMEHSIRRLGHHDGCRSREQIVQRCARLDRIFRVIKRERRVKTQGEVEPGAFRELGGIGMHLGPDGVPIRAGNGRHRFAMAWILRIARIPVRIGWVHHSALPVLAELRQEPKGSRIHVRQEGL